MDIQQIPSDQFAERPLQTVIDTLVIHSMHHPENPQLCFCAKSCKQWLDQCGVSAHFIIDRSGEVWQTVAVEKMAWHAGQSKMPFEHDHRERVNDFSIGVELLASETSGITQEQYSSLLALVAYLKSDYPLQKIVGHNHIAPGRKTDPWLFDWDYFLQLLKKSHLELDAVGLAHNKL